MTLHPQAKTYFITGTALLALAVLIGAFGAHGLKAIVTPEKLITFETGVRYQFYHAFGILFLGIFQQLYNQTKTNISFYSFIVGILLFSFNCYFYVLSNIKVFAMIVPVGGILFVIGWAGFFWQAIKLK
ncbi:MAG: DUF423 domain-containing protein [Bacteriovoracaceae bacterium]